MDLLREILAQTSPITHNLADKFELELDWIRCRVKRKNTSQRLDGKSRFSLKIKKHRLSLCLFWALPSSCVCVCVCVFALTSCENLRQQKRDCLLEISILPTSLPSSNFELWAPLATFANSARAQLRNNDATAVISSSSKLEIIYHSCWWRIHERAANEKIDRQAGRQTNKLLCWCLDLTWPRANLRRVFETQSGGNNNNSNSCLLFIMPKKFETLWIHYYLLLIAQQWSISERRRRSEQVFLNNHRVE